MGVHPIGNAQAAYAEQGVVFQPGLLSQEDLREAEKIFAWSLDHPSQNAHDFDGGEDASAVFFEDIDNLAAREIYLPFLSKSSLGPFLSTLWGGSPVWYLYEQIFLKEGRSVRRTPWHQDISYMPISGDHLAVAWISLDLLSKEECLEVVRGSHRGTVYGPPSFDAADDTALHPDGAAMPPMPNIEGCREAWDIVSWPVAPGDVLVFHPAALHGGGPIESGRRRRTLALRFFGENAFYRGGPAGDGRQTGVAGSFDLVGGELKRNAPLRHTHFPRLV